MSENVKHVRKEVNALLPQWDTINDCMLGEFVIKQKGAIYLPKPDATNISAANDVRYTQYVQRAVFYNVVRRTITGLVGLVFQREPVVELPTGLKVLEKDADGGGVSLIQIAKAALTKTITVGRIGLFVDYPPVKTENNAPISIAQQQSLNLRPTITSYKAEDIINWRWDAIGGRKLPTLVVLRELYILKDDGFFAETEIQYRVLRLKNGVFTQQLYKADGATAEAEITPKDASGKPLNHIPFYFVGPENNDPEPDQPPAYDMAILNIAHYRNSADYEESVYIVGQPTPYFTNLDENWVKNVLKGEILLGARAAIPLPIGGTAGLLQAQPNGLVKEAMEQKEKQMVALGARLVQQQAVARTATEATQDQASTDSVLANSAQNVVEAISKCLADAALYSGDSQASKFYLNTEFDLTTLSPEMLKALSELHDGNKITTSEFRDSLTRAGIATLTREEFDKEVANDISFAAENAKTMVEASQIPEAAPVTE